MEEREGGAIPLRVSHKRHSFHSLSSVCSRHVPAPPHPSLPQLLLFIAQQARIFVGEIDLPGMDAAQWHQELGLVKTMEEMIMAGNPNPNPNPNPNAIPNPPPAPPSGAEAQRTPGPPAVAGTGSTMRRARPQKEKAINCPRCNSTNTKFCYYNNYSLQQPRYFCKTCHRYWTDGGSLRNVPVGSGLRKNKRSSPSFVVSSAAASTSAAPPGAVPACGMAAKNPKSIHEGANDLNLALPHHLHHGRVLHPSEFAAFPSLESSSVCNPGGAMAANGTGGGRSIGAFSAMELLRSTGCYVPLQLGMLLEYAAAGFMPLPQQQHHQQQQQVHNLLGFSLDMGGGGDAGGYGACNAGLQGAQENATARLLFPLEELKPGVNAAGGGANGGGGDQFEHIKDQGGGNNSMTGNGSRNGAGVGGGSW